VFSPLELEYFICGDSKLLVDQMKEIFHFQDGTEEDRERFITMLGELTSDEQFQLLAFCMISPSLPPPASPQLEICVRSWTVQIFQLPTSVSANSRSVGARAQTIWNRRSGWQSNWEKPSSWHK
jgi:hypothetical protein